MEDNATRGTGNGALQLNWPKNKPWAGKWLHRYFRIVFGLVGLRYAGWTTRDGFVDVQGNFGQYGG